MTASAGFEQVLIAEGERSGATIAIAVHSTRLGPALGGARLWHYPDLADAVGDAKRLAEAMTYKAAVAGLELGGGKGVIASPDAAPPSGELRRAMLLDFGDAVESLGGDYVTAEDVGTRASDMVVIQERTAHVVGLPRELGGSGDPSPVTARGVLASIRACLKHRFGQGSPAGCRVCIVGVGSVGTHLAHMLAAAGADLVLADVNPGRRALADELGARWADAEEALLQPCDVLAPCALGGAIDRAVARELSCEIVCGAANNVLAEDTVAGALADRGVLFAPDFVANAGGLISVYAELRDLDRAEVLELADGIADAIEAILVTAEELDRTPLEAARRLAEKRLALSPAATAA
jgi:leucine dehydrogenase